jgi:hypothetical protein
MSGFGTSQSELTASCYILTMDTGLFCVSLAEPPKPSFANPHFPGVRLSLPPGPESEHRSVTICTFRADGWLDMDRPAALVHVHNGPGRLLMTIYHEASQPRDASPKLAITQLAQTIPPPPHATAHAPLPFAAPAPAVPLPAAPSPGFASPIPAPAPADAIGQPSAPMTDLRPASPLTDALILSHIRNRGDVRTRLTEWVGLPGSRLWVEGFVINLPPGWSPNDVEYQGIVARTGPTPWLSCPDFCGSKGQTMPLLGFGVRLKGEAARLYTCSYRASFVDGTTSGPMPQGQLCQSTSMAALEAFQITLTRR